MTFTRNDVEVTFDGVPTVAPGIVVLTVSPEAKPEPLTVTGVVLPGVRLFGFRLLTAGG